MRHSCQFYNNLSDHLHNFHIKSLRNPLFSNHIQIGSVNNPLHVEITNFCHSHQLDDLRKLLYIHESIIILNPFFLLYIHILPSKLLGISLRYLSN